ncbi:MAG: hypothetical protein PHF63_05280 [Herbinix sp.]|nr:hypothetical protein [Herbinix sp.]
MNTKNDFYSIVEEVTEKRVKYHDLYEIAAYLESVGWNDRRAFAAYGFNNIFEMAQQVFDIVDSKTSVSTYVPPEKLNIFNFIINSIKNFFRGLIFALPMAISVVSMLTLRFSLWSYENLTTDLATSIAVGTILSFMTVGGFTQAIARRGFFYIIMGYYNMARKVTFSFIKIGYVTIFTFALLLLAISYIFSFFPMKMLLIAILYYIFLSSIWLSVTVMYILRKEFAFTGLIAFGIVLVGFLFLIMDINIIVSQLISLVVVTILCLLLVIYFFHKAELKMEKGLSPKMPKLSVTFYTVVPYFLYGFSYFTFLYTDRVIAWSANDSSNMPYIIWFRGAYELGLDFALFTLIIPTGVIEVVVYSIMKQLELQIKNFTLYNTNELNNLFKKKYTKNLFITIVVSLLSGVFIYLLLLYIDKNYSAVLRFSIAENPTILFVFTCSIIAYSILAVGLMNSVLLFSLSQPKIINKALGASLAINIGVGFIGSRWFSWMQNNLWNNVPFHGIEGYAFAICGLLAGSIYFMIKSTKTVYEVFDHLDYYLYAMS